MRFLSRILLGVGRDLKDLMGYLEGQGVMDLVQPTLNQWQRRAMGEFGLATGMDVPNNLSLSRQGNHPAVLVHWAVVGLLLSMLEPHQRGNLRNQFPISTRERGHLQPLPEAFDACCQYDKLVQEVGLWMGSDPVTVFGKATPEPGFEVDLKSALLTFSDPELYPTEEQVKCLRAKGFHISVGIRPKIDPSERQLDRLAKLLEMPEVCALGEIGIDHSVPIGRWASQTLNIQKILGCLAVRSNKIICVKCRGVAGEDPSEAYDTLRMALNQFVTGVQVIHLHCFDGNKEVVDRWLSSFTLTYFSFARVVDHFTDDQRAALRAIDDARILLETNSPFIKFGGNRASTPAQIGMAARSVAEIRGGTSRTVLALATLKARRLFDQRLEPACDWTNTQAKPFSRRR